MDPERRFALHYSPVVGLASLETPALPLGLKLEVLPKGSAQTISVNLGKKFWSSLVAISATPAYIRYPAPARNARPADQQEEADRSSMPGSAARNEGFTDQEGIDSIFPHQRHIFRCQDAAR